MSKHDPSFCCIQETYFSDKDRGTGLYLLFSCPDYNIYPSEKGLKFAVYGLYLSLKFGKIILQTLHPTLHVTQH